MKISYSRVETFKKCPYQYKLRYIDKLKAYDENDPQDALKLGTALHKGIETDVKTAIDEYYMSYPVINDLHVIEAIKLEYWIPKVKELLPKGKNEVKIECLDFIGYIDYLTDDGEIYDYKYSNNIERYLESKQLLVYKRFAEKLLDIKVKKLHFIFIPKIMIRQKKTESMFDFKKRLMEELKKSSIKIVDVDYNETKFKEFLEDVKLVKTCTNFKKNPSGLCKFCEFESYCLSGDTLNIVDSRWYENIKEEN